MIIEVRDKNKSKNSRHILKDIKNGIKTGFDAFGYVLIIAVLTGYIIPPWEVLRKEKDESSIFYIFSRTTFIILYSIFIYIPPILFLLSLFVF